MTDHIDHHGLLGRFLDLDFGNGPRGGQKKHHDNDHGDDRPGDFYRRRPVDLRGVATFVAGPRAELYDAPEKNALRDQKDHRANPDHQPRNVLDLLPGHRDRIENIGVLVGHGAFRPGGQRPQRKNGEDTPQSLANNIGH